MVADPNKALKAIHKLLVHGRILAHEGLKGAELVDFFDTLEYLPALMLERDDKSAWFGEYLKEICLRFRCDHIYLRYIE